MASVWLARTSQWVEKLFNVKGSPVLSDIEPTLRVVLPWFTGNEDRAPALWNRYSFGASSPAVAGQLSALQLRNPSGSNVVAVIESLNFWSGTSMGVNVVLKAGAADFASAIVAQRADPRGQLLPTLTATLGSAAAQTGGTVMATIVGVNLLLSLIQTLNQEIVITPGDSVSIWGQIVNTALVGSFTWRERALQQSELT